MGRAESRGPMVPHESSVAAAVARGRWRLPAERGCAVGQLSAVRSHRKLERRTEWASQLGLHGHADERPAAARLPVLAHKPLTRFPALLVLIALSVVTDSLSADWRHYGGGPDQIRYSPL